MQDGKFHPHTDYKKGVRKSRDQSTKTKGVRLRRGLKSFRIIPTFGNTVVLGAKNKSEAIKNYWKGMEWKEKDLGITYDVDIESVEEINERKERDHVHTLIPYWGGHYCPKCTTGKYAKMEGTRTIEDYRNQHGIRKKLDDDSFVVLWNVKSNGGKIDPLWRTRGKANWIEPKKVYRIAKELEEQGMIKLTPTRNYMDYSYGTKNEAPDPTYYAEVTPKGLEYFNIQKEMGRTENLPKHNPLIKYNEEYSYMSPKERVANMQELMSKGLANKYNLKLSAQALVKSKIMTKSGKVLNREKALEWFK